MIASRSCYSPNNDERVRAYNERLHAQHDHSYLVHAGRVASGVRTQAELIRLPIPKHRALVAVSKVKRKKTRAAK
jgi:hypothetical protein